jgi:tryptophanyl-tRNA synthetase
VQPTGNLHLGNYLGAITKFVALQAEHDCLYCVVDLHAITVFQDPDELTCNTREVTAAFIASGIDPTRHIVFNQSQVSGHAELAWIFNCVARIGWLNRMTQFKEKAGKDRENASAGLYVYPNLMAADILLYHATHVPVGIFAGLAATSKDAVLRDYGNATFSKFKEALAELAAAKLTPIGTEMRRLMADPVEIDRILVDGAARAHSIADPILAKTKDIVGFIRS